MSIDWFTLGAQVFNFVLLVYVLKRLLYKPVLEAIAKREEGIRERLERAERLQLEAGEQDARLQESRLELEQSRTTLMVEAERAANARRDALLKAVKEEVKVVRQEWQASLRGEQATFLEDLRRRLSTEVYSVVRRVLADLADASLEDRVIEVFLARVASMEEEERAEFSQALHRSRSRARVRSAFPIAEERREALRAAVRVWDPSADVEFVSDPALTLGIEIGADDRKIAWSAGDYVQALESDTAEYLRAEIG